VTGREWCARTCSASRGTVKGRAAASAAAVASKHSALIPAATPPPPPSAGSIKSHSALPALHLHPLRHMMEVSSVI
jgi:hypothetical protein